MTRSYEEVRDHLYPDGAVIYSEEEYEEYLAKLHEQLPNNGLVIEIEEDFELKSKDQLNERSSR